ncbi:RNA methyltransferase [Rhodocaloribacter litoris]|uniref:TrmH family RNA methyltransferase n=1 Tax=Rhodocaloribacter litoris TaxID=2558931 RepID=UPI001424570A|nr:RNA methyltransferase [Rhodocaloribacter litoris]QXD14227.1 RNA methyltransferase [Rhodocaloribacter litoris]GIV59898.1 MAG: RNA methyltransferase [Rhodothermaceae bacterium]
MTNRRRKEIASLVHRKYRERLGQFCVEGVRSVEAAVAAGAPLVELVVGEAARADDRVRALLEQAGVPVHVLPDREVARLSDVQASQGVLAVARTVLVPETTLHTHRTVLVLDGLQDPGNVGTNLRTAAWFGVEAVLAGPGTADFFNPKAVRAAMGGLWDVRLARTADLPAALERLRRAGFALYGADLDGIEVHAWTPPFPSALVLGSEAHGLTPGVAACLDARVTVPGHTARRGAESLNVAVAAGILMAQWFKSS